MHGQQNIKISWKVKAASP